MMFQLGYWFEISLHLTRFSHFLGSPPEKTPGSATKTSKKPAPIAIPTLASTFPFSVMHLLSAVRAALIANYGDGAYEFHDQHERVTYARERLDFDIPYATSEGSLLGHSDQGAGASGAERVESKEVDGDQRPHSFRGIPFSELVRRVHENPGDHRILQTVEPLQVSIADSDVPPNYLISGCC